MNNKPGNNLQEKEKWNHPASGGKGEKEFISVGQGRMEQEQLTLEARPNTSRVSSSQGFKYSLFSLLA